MIDPVWAGSISASDVRSRSWLTEQQMPLMPWSSQARGFFTGRAYPEDHSDPELVRCWYSEDNFLRLERTSSLAQQLGVLPIAAPAAPPEDAEQAARLDEAERLVQEGHYEAAIALFEQIGQHGRTSWAYEQYAEFLAEAGRYQDAYEQMRCAMQRNG